MECAASRTALGLFRIQGRRLRLEQHAVELLPATAGEADRWMEQTRDALAALGRRLEVTGPVMVVLPPHLMLAKIIRVPRFERAKREKAIRFAAEEGIPCALADVVWDHVAAAEHDLEVMLAAVRRDAVEALCGAVKAAGFEVRRVLPSSLATLAAFRLAPEVKEPALVLNVGARSTTLLMVEGRRFVVRSMGFGIQGAVMDRGDLREVLATRLAQEITRSILHFRRQGWLATPAGVHLTGGGAHLAGLDEALAARVKLPVVRLEVAGAIEMGSGLSDGEAAAGTSLLTDLVGAAAVQLLAGQPTMNLLPPSFRQAKERRHRQLQLAGVTLLMVAAGWSYRDVRAPVGARPAAVAIVEREPAPVLAEPATLAPHNDAGEDPPPFDVELLEIRNEPFPLQLAGYFGTPGNYVVAFVGVDQPETQLVRSGHRFGQLGLTLRNFEVKKVAVAHGGGWLVHEAGGFAVLHDDSTGREIVLDSRGQQPADQPEARLRVGSASQPLILREGETFPDGAATCRIERIQIDPPEVIVARRTPGSPLPATHVLRLAALDAEINVAMTPSKEFPALSETALAATGR